MKTLQTLILAALAGSTLNLRADDMKLEQCPAAVQDTIRTKARDGRIDDINLITIEGRALYVAELDLKGDKDLKLHVGSDGKLIKTREDAALGDAPDAVQDAVKKLVPAGGKVDDADKEIATGKVRSTGPMPQTWASSSPRTARCFAGRKIPEIDKNPRLLKVPVPGR